MTKQELIEKINQLPDNTRIESRLDYQDDDCCSYVIHFDQCGSPTNVIDILGEDVVE